MSKKNKTTVRQNEEAKYLLNFLYEQIADRVSLGKDEEVSIKNESVAHLLSTDSVKRVIKEIERLDPNAKTIVKFGGSWKNVRLASLDELYGRTNEKKKNKNREFLKKIDEEIGLSNIINAVGIIGLSEAFAEDQQIKDGYEREFNEILFEKYFSRDKMLTEEQIQKRIPRYMEGYIWRLKDFVYNLAEYVNPDVFLRLYVIRQLEGYEEYREKFPQIDFDPEKLQEYKDELKKALSLIQKNNEMIIKIANKEGACQASMSEQELIELIDEMGSEDYIGITELTSLRAAVTSGEITLDKLNEKQIKKLKLDFKTMKKLCEMDSNNIKYLLDNNFKGVNIRIIKPEGLLKSILGSKNPYSEELALSVVNYRLKNNLEIDTKKILKLYEQGKIKIEDLQNIIDKNIPLVDDQLILERYLEYKDEKDSVEKENKKQTLIRDVELYEQSIRKSKSRKERQELGDIFISSLDSLEKEDLFELYNLNLITIENVIDWGDEQEVYKIFSQDMLRQSDLLLALRTKKLSDECAMRLIKEYKATNEEKFTLIWAAYDEVEDEELVKKLVGIICNSKGEKFPKTEGKEKNQDKEGKETESNVPKTEKNHRRIFNVDERLKLFKLLDEDFEFKLLSDGHIILEYPNLSLNRCDESSKGLIIIEKLFETSRDGDTDFAYGRATYLMSKEVYDQVKDDLVKKEEKSIIEGHEDDKENLIVCRRYLTDLKGEGKTIQVYHSGNWGKHLIENLDTNLNTKRELTQEDNKNTKLYSDKELEDLKDVLDKLKQRMLEEKKITKE